MSKRERATSHPSNPLTKREWNGIPVKEQANYMYGSSGGYLN